MYWQRFVLSESFTQGATEEEIGPLVLTSLDCNYAYKIPGIKNYRSINT